MTEEALGIPNNEILYYKINPNQNITDEYFYTIEFLSQFMKKFAIENNLNIKDIQTKFINYGDTELVYVLSFNNKYITLLMGQPNIEFGAIKQEHDILRTLNNKDKSVVSPIDFFSMQTNKFSRELFATPYIYQARCIGSQENGYGVYIPEPFYHFETFNPIQTDIVNSCMIAKLIFLFDEKNNLGISHCKIGGGDFMLDKDWNSHSPEVLDTLKKMKLIAAREQISCSLSNYIELIRTEFSKPTYYFDENERDKDILVNYKNRFPMTKKQIEDGIEIGKNLRNSIMKDNQIAK